MPFRTFWTRRRIQFYPRLRGPGIFKRLRFQTLPQSLYVHGLFRLRAGPRN